MSKRQVIILWSIAAVLALVVLAVKLGQGDPAQVATKREPGQTLFEFFPAKDITQVVIEGAKESVTLQKDGETWLVKERDNYPGDTIAVLDLIRSINDLEIIRAIEAGPSLAPRFGMDTETDSPEERGLEIGFFGKEGELARVSLGKSIELSSSGNIPGATMMVGRYLRNHADETGFYAGTEMFSSVNADAKNWLRDTFISPEKIESIEVTKPDSPEIEWHLKRESEEASFQVVGGKPNEVANSNLSNRLGGLFSYARFEDVIPKDKVEKLGSEKGRIKATIKTFEGFTYGLQLVPSADNGQQYLLQVKVEASLPDQRKKAEGESAENSAKLDKAFAERRQILQEKLGEAKFFEGRTYLMGKSNVDLLLHNRGEMVVSVEPPKPAEGEAQPPEMLTVPQEP